MGFAQLSSKAPGFSFALTAETRAQRVQRMLSHLASLAVHLVVMMLLLGPGLTISRNAQPELIVAQLLLPQHESEVKAESRRAGSGPHVVVKPTKTSVSARKDLKGLKVRVLPDREHQLVSVLKKHGGFIGLARFENPWQLVEVRQPGQQRGWPFDGRVDRWLAFKIVEPYLMPELRIGDDADYVVYALFPLDYQARILEAARDYLKALGCPELMDDGTELVLAFDSRQPAGVRIIAVERDGLKCTGNQASLATIGGVNEKTVVTPRVSPDFFAREVGQ